MTHGQRTAKRPRRCTATAIHGNDHSRHEPLATTQPCPALDNRRGDRSQLNGNDTALHGSVPGALALRRARTPACIAWRGRETILAMHDLGCAAGEQADAADEAHGGWKDSKVAHLHLKSASQLIRGVRPTVTRER